MTIFFLIYITANRCLSTSRSEDMVDYQSYFAGYCLTGEEEITDEVYCDCPGFGDVCDASLIIANCTLTAIRGGGIDVTQTYIDLALAPIGCEDPTELTPDDRFGADLDFTPDVVC